MIVAIIFVVVVIYARFIVKLITTNFYIAVAYAITIILITQKIIVNCYIRIDILLLIIVINICGVVFTNWCC